MENITAKCHRNLFQTVILISLFSVGLAIECFQCNSVEHAGCNDLTVNDTNSQYYRKCDGNYQGQPPFCRKVVTEIFDVPDSLRVSRSCGWIRTGSTNSCRKADTDFIKKRLCECSSNACNTSDRKMASFLFVFATTIVSGVFRQLDFI